MINLNEVLRPPRWSAAPASRCFQRDLRPTHCGSATTPTSLRRSGGGSADVVLAALREAGAPCREGHPSPRRALVPLRGRSLRTYLTSPWSPSPLSAGSRPRSPICAGRSTKLVASVALTGTEGARLRPPCRPKPRPYAPASCWGTPTRPPPNGWASRSSWSSPRSSSRAAVFVA